MNPPNSWASWMPLVASLVGFLGGLAGVFLGNHLALAREWRGKVVEARMRRRQRWEEFEDKSLIEFQDGSPRLIERCRNIMMTMISNVLLGSVRENGKDLTDGMVGLEIALFVLLNLATRIRDEATQRESLHFIDAAIQFRDASYQSLGRFSEGPAAFDAEVAKLDDLMQELQRRCMAVSVRIGDRVRARIEAELAEADAEAADERARQADSLSARWARMAKRVRAGVREVAADHPPTP